MNWWMLLAQAGEKAARKSDVITRSRNFKPRGGDGDDPSFSMGWLIVVLYLAAAGLAFWAMTCEEQAVRRGSRSRAPWFWTVAGVLLAIFGLSKMLGAQGWLDDLARDTLRSEEMYQDRRPVQALLIIQMAIVGLVALAAAGWFLRRVWREYLVPIGALIYLVTIVVIRAISLHQIDAAMRESMCMGITLGDFMDLLGLIAFGAAAVIAARRPSGASLEPRGDGRWIG